MKLTIITIAYNSAKEIRRTIESVLNQERGDIPYTIEYLIIDGASSDATVEIAESYIPAMTAGGIDYRISSEPDRGIYDAMNKAYGLSNGDIIAVCNDRLCQPEAVSSLVAAIETGGVSCVGAHADLVYVDGERVVRRWHMGEGKLSEGWMPGHPTLFLKREVYEKYGLYDTSYHCAADYEFMVRILYRKERFQNRYS